MRIFGSSFDQCVACGSTDLRLWAEKKFWFTDNQNSQAFKISKCHNCGTGFLNPPPHEELLGNIYAKSGHALTAPVSLAKVLENERRFPNSTVDADRMVGYGKNLDVSSNGTALDVGSGYGFITKALREADYVTTSINPGEYENEVFEELNGFSPMPMMFESFHADSKYGLVVMSQVLEHIVSPRVAVDKVAAMLERGGVFVCAVPNFQSVLVRTLGLKENSCLWVPEHVNYFTCEGLCKMMEAAGLHIVRREFISRFRYDALSRRLSWERTGLRILDGLVKYSQLPLNRLFNALGMGVYINIYARKV